MLFNYCKSVVISVLTGCIVLITPSCSNEQAAGNNGGTVVDSSSAIADSVRSSGNTRTSKADSLSDRFRKIGYHKVVVSSARILDSLRRVCAKTDSSMTMYRIITLLNRKDLRFVRLGDTVVMPDSVVDDMLAYSIFPQYWKAADTINKIIVVSAKWQSYACYERGVLVRFAATNTGEERKPTLPGRYTANWKQRLRVSSLNSSWILPYTVNIHKHAGTAFHQFTMPGRPVSHSCLRQLMHDAMWLFNWVAVPRYDSTSKATVPKVGTPVLVLDVFDFTRPKGGPWLDVGSNQDVMIELPQDPLAMEEALIPISQIPHGGRGSLPNKQRYLTADSVLRERGIIREGVTLRESITYRKRKRATAGSETPSGSPASAPAKSNGN